MAEPKVVQIDDLVSISENALVTIAGIAVSEVEGVYSKFSREQNGLDKSEIKAFKKQIKFVEHDKGIVFDVDIKVIYGSNLEETSKAVQEAVFLAIESNVGVKPYKVNVIVTGIAF